MKNQQKHKILKQVEKVRSKYGKRVQDIMRVWGVREREWGREGKKVICFSV